VAMWLAWFKQERKGSTTQEGKKRPLASCDLEDILYQLSTSIKGKTKKERRDYHKSLDSSFKEFP
jgi:hypothetical protein